MKKASKSKSEQNQLSRRRFFEMGGALVIGGSVAGGAGGEEAKAQNGDKGELGEEAVPKVHAHRTLGRTGFKISDISMGGTRNRDPGVVRYAYDQGVNHFDTAERYINGESERIIGEALKHIDRKKIFLTTKLYIQEKDTEATVLERFRKCQERLGTDYVDALFMHAVNDPDMLNHEGFHAATDQLKKEGRLKHIGLSSHGGRGHEDDIVEKVLCKAAEDGRFDVMLLIYNFLNKEPGEKILAACKKNNVGTVAMKTAPGVLEVVPVDPDNLTKEQEEMVKRFNGFGLEREAAIKRLQGGIKRDKENFEKSKPFVAKHGIKTKEHLHQASIQWVLKNKDMHSVCVSFGDYELVDQILSVSGKELSHASHELLRDYRKTFSDQYCRHGCTHCFGKCPEGLPISTIMRYAYYFQCQGREKDAMVMYQRLKGRDATQCLTCDAPCAKACPHNVDVRAQLLQAHSLLSLC